MKNNKVLLSPYEQTKHILDEIIERIKGLEFSKLITTLDKNKDFIDKSEIIVNNIKSERAREEDCIEQEYIDAVEGEKNAERLRRDCEYIRGICQLTITHKSNNQEVVGTAKDVLYQLYLVFALFLLCHCEEAPGADAAIS